ncbi:hypothetical protein [Vineibacter terrae]|uniref:Uncharacterized protein n=1 Tax=Vineibacter terrae TaxID=2586908 RepID=A0A5C8PJM8_9HYPH|nr:hypothetical protein [Vineibacter terrae]TXL73603.1 hypothetical protein FHP25_20715 [Vineibacter terrae]HEX2889328.1 hypothetical protein [Vineibacter terrae]
MPQRHLRGFTVAAVSVLIAGGLAMGAAQAADPAPLLRDANPAQTHDLAGGVSLAREMRAQPAPAGQDMRGVTPDRLATQPIQPSVTDRKAGAASRISGKAGGTLVPIGTLNIVRGEQPRLQVDDSIAHLPPRDTPGL